MSLPRAQQSAPFALLLLAEAFNAVHFPILPIVQQLNNGKLHFYKRNTRLYTPKDFDSSPYVDVIKHPLYDLEELAAYRHLSWVHGTIVHTDDDPCFRPQPVATTATPPPPLLTKLAGREFPPSQKRPPEKDRFCLEEIVKINSCKAANY